MLLPRRLAAQDGRLATSSAPLRRKLLVAKNPLLLSCLLGRHINVVTMQRNQGIRLKVLPSVQHLAARFSEALKAARAP